jgi:hypothetical protein
MTELEPFTYAMYNNLLSERSLKLIGEANRDGEVTAAIERSWGVRDASDITFVNLLMDDSVSIEDHIDTLREGHNTVLASLREAGMPNVMVSTRMLNGRVCNPFAPLEQVPELRRGDFMPLGGTPLYYSSRLFLASIIGKGAELQMKRIDVRSATLILTDGEDNDSKGVGPESVAPLVQDMIASGNHIVMGVGVGTESTFRPIFRAMGIPDKWIYASVAKDELLSFLRRFGEMGKQLALESNKAPKRR